MQKWYYFAMLRKFQDIPHQNALNVDSATAEIPWNDPLSYMYISMNDVTHHFAIHKQFSGVSETE